MGTNKRVDRTDNAKRVSEAESLNEGFTEIFTKAFKDMFEILRVGIKDIVVTTWQAQKKIWNKYKIIRFINMVDKAEEFIKKNNLKAIDPELVRKFGETYRAEGIKLSKAIDADEKAMQRVKKEISSQYMTVMRPVYRNLLQGQSGALLFLSNPAVYLAALGARLVTDPNPIGSFANSDLAQSSDLTVGMLNNLTQKQDNLVKELVNGFGASSVVSIDNRFSERSFESKGRLNEQELSDEELEVKLRDLGFTDPVELFNYMPAFQELKKLSDEILKEKLTLLSRIREDQKEQIQVLKQTIEAETMEDLRKMSPEMDDEMKEFEQKIGERIDEDVQKIMENPEAVEKIVSDLNIKDSSTEAIEDAVRTRVSEEMSKQVKAELESGLKKQKEVARNALAVIERGILSVAASGVVLEGDFEIGQMPLPGEPDWNTLQKTEAGRLWKKAVEDYLESCVTLKM